MEISSFISLNKNLIENSFRYLSSSEKLEIHSSIKNKKIWRILTNQLYKSFICDPRNLHEICTISNQFQTSFWLEYLMILSKNIKNKSFLAFAGKFKVSLVDLLTNEITDSFYIGLDVPISCLGHYCDKENQTDLIFVSMYFATIRVFSSKINYQVLMLIDSDNSCLINNFVVFNDRYDNNGYIICSLRTYDNSLKIWDMKGNFIRSLESKYQNFNYIKLFHKKDTKKYYVIHLNEDIIALYDFDNGNIFRKFETEPEWRFSAICITRNSKDFLIISNDSSISFWNLTDNLLERRIKLGNKDECSRGLIKWNHNFLTF